MCSYGFVFFFNFTMGAICMIKKEKRRRWWRTERRRWWRTELIGRVQQAGALSGNCFPLHATRSKFILDSAERLRYVLLP
jgi:hypothetical protein